jgi:hypothetical protein
MSINWEKIEKSKGEERARSAALPIGEKFRILEQMRQRSVAIKAHKKISVEKDGTKREKA